MFGLVANRVFYVVRLFAKPSEFNTFLNYLLAHLCFRA